MRFATISKGNTAQRPSTPDDGWQHVNTEKGTFDVWNGHEWMEFGPGGLSYPLDNKMLGGHHSEEKNIAFIMMAINDEPKMEDVLNTLKEIFKPLVGDRTIRIDDVEHSGKITDLILEYLRESKYLICDVTKERPNVYYELGYAHALGKEVILIADFGTKLHFDIKDYNVIFYKNMTGLKEKLKKRLFQK
ncbi:MAG: hypothetical protein V3V74_07815 [Nitrosomonadaceae bacterium]